MTLDVISPIDYQDCSFSFTNNNFCNAIALVSQKKNDFIRFYVLLFGSNFLQIRLKN